MVFTSSTFGRTILRSTRSFAPRQSTSRHFRPKAFTDAQPEANTYQSNRALQVTQSRPSTRNARGAQELAATHTICGGQRLSTARWRADIATPKSAGIDANSH